MKRNRHAIAAKRRSPAAIAVLGLAIGLLLYFSDFAANALRAQQPAPGGQPAQQEELQRWFDKRVKELGGLISYRIGDPDKPAVNLFLSEKKATDDDIAGIPQAFPELNYIDLRKTLISDLAVARLRGLQKLDCLDLSETAITDKSLEVTKDFPAIAQLKLRQTKITDEGLRHLGGRPWTLLELGSNGITNRGMELLAQCKSIEDLDLAGNPIDNEGLRHLATITSLQDLNLCNTKISDVKDLESLTILKGLGLSYTDVTDEALEHVKKLPNLLELDIIGTKITTEAIDKFRKEFPKVKCITVERKPPNFNY